MKVLWLLLCVPSGPMRKENKQTLARAEMTMVRWMCGVCQSDRCSSVVQRDRLVLWFFLLSP